METYHVKKNIRVFGIRVKTFPSGVGEAYQALANKIYDAYDRGYYGISYITSEGIVYIATAEEKYEHEAEKYKYEEYIIEKGDYLIVLVKDWRKKTDCIKDVFHEMMQDSHFDDTKPCIEWYKNDDEMLCMVRSKIQTSNKLYVEARESI